MPVFVVTGKLGTGKSKYCVGKMRAALLAGRKVATNYDLYMEHLLPQSSKAVAMRIPDKPTSSDLDAIGHGNPDSYDEERNGVMVLDELGSWLNSRQFQNEHRAGLIEWLIHARKKGWDVYLIVQALDMVDKQVRTGLAEYLVKCIRADKIKIPIVGGALGKFGKLPRLHVAQITMADIPGVIIDREWFRGDHLHAAYDTRQIFSNDSHGPHSLLSAWHLKGRFAAPVVKRSWWSLFFRPSARPAHKDKPQLLARLAKLPPDRAVYWTRRLTSEGLL